MNKVYIQLCTSGLPCMCGKLEGLNIPNTTSINKPDQKNCSIVADLCCRDLWQRFHELGTEMIVTKAGSRRMFPTIKVRLSGLNPNISYIVFLDIIPFDNKRYRYIYHSSQWTVAGEGDPSLAPCVYIHPDSPATGQLWMAQGVIAFDKLKLTNNKNPKVRGQISLHSMQKYVPRIHVLPIVELSSPVANEDLITNALTFSFKETQFITVTAYQNQKITQLKIASNPFAKGFRVAVRNRQLDLNLPRKLSTQEIFATFSDSNCASAFQKFQPNLKKSKSISEETQAVPRPMETSLVYPLFSNGYKQSSYNVKEISIFKKIF